MTPTWTEEDLDAISGTGEIDIAPTQNDGTARRATTIWAVRVGEDLYVRSYRGPNGSWYRAAQRTHQGIVRARSIERTVTFDDGCRTDRTAVDDAYRRKYGHSSYVDAMVTPDAVATTMRLLPR